MNIRKIRKRSQEKHGHWTVARRFKKRSQVMVNGKLVHVYFTMYESHAEHIWKA